MSKFGRRLIVSIMLVIISLGAVSMVINTQFVERYYLKIKRNELEQAYKKIERATDMDLYQVVQEINQGESLFVVSVPWVEDIAEINDQLRIELGYRGINVKKLWIWEGFFNRIKNGESVNGIYNQQKFNYSILMKLAKKEGELIAIINIIPHTADVIKIINVFTIGIWIGSLILMLIVIIFFIKRLTYPLVAMKELADDISHLHFKKIEIQTKDELEELAESINRMSEKLEYSHKKLENKNKYMKQLLSDASHELKTPIALIKAYSTGMQDGIDDGTFLETIIEQNEMMDRIVNQLLNLCRIEQKEEKLEKVNISHLLESLIKSNKIYITQEKIALVTHIEEGIGSLVDEEALVSIWTNFMTNAIKYNTDDQIEIKLGRKDKKVYFEISNGVSEKIVEHLPYIWKPFYVGEESRNKDMCGTGLGLYIVQQLLQKFNMEYGVKVEAEKICFYMYLKEEL